MVKHNWLVLVSAAALLCLPEARAQAPVAEAQAAPVAEAQAAPVAEAQAAPVAEAQADPVRQTQAVPAAEVQAGEAPSTLQNVVSRLRPQVTLYYARGLSNERYSSFHHSMGIQLGLGVLIDPTLIARASISLAREFGMPIEKFRASNAALSLTKMFKFEKVGWLMPVVFGRLPTNDDDRDYLTYRGTVGAGVSLTNDEIFTFRNGIHAIGATLDISGARSFFQYTTSIEGAYQNRLWTLSAGGSLVYTLYQRLSFIVSLGNELHWTSVGRINDRYQIAGAIQFIAPYNLRLTLRAATADRTFDYDQVTPNLRLYTPENSFVMFTLGYSPRQETVTQ
jgi:hypothetical protein